jgi:hypothetical protein
MSRTVLNAEMRDTKEGTVYPSPLAEFPLLSGFGAGYPDYPWFFGTDGAYTTFGLVATGQWETAENHLNLVRSVSQAVNGSTGKVLHEIVTDGSIYFGTNAQPGDTNETAEFASAVATVWRWSGDNGFRDENYDFIKTGLNYLEASLDTYPDGWPEGAGMVEATGMGAKKLDVAVYTIRALNDLAEMATSKGDSATAKWATGLATKLAVKFDSDWWMTSLGLYADSLALNHQVPTDPGAATGSAPVTQLQQYYWTNATPMETAFATVQHGAAALTQLENTQLPSPIFTGATGPIIYDYLGIRPDVPNGQLVVVPELPGAWPTLSVNNLRVGSGTIAVGAKQNGNQYTTTLTAPTGYNVQIGYVIPPGTKPISVTLGGTVVKYQTIATTRGNEVVVQTPSGPNMTLVVTAQ